MNRDLERREPMMLILSSPSGAGKTTLARRLLKDEPELAISVSATTRAPRNGEVDGRDYHFIDQETFFARLERGEFLEHAAVHGNYYGTLKSEVDDLIAAGHDVLFDIDYQGTQQLNRSSRAGRIVSIFILPPSMEELERRLRTRAQDSDETVARRMAKARDEIGHWAEYDYVLINDDLERCYGEIKLILSGERLKSSRQRDLAEFVNRLIGR